MIRIASSKTRILAALLASLGLWILAGCETMEGMGRDVESAGEEIEEAAD
ncbi:entericidin A/B family lipoprotein [Gilvimarinus sp. F26214L]